MLCNPFLQGASTQKRCTVCDRVLSDGVCIFGGCKPADIAPLPIEPPAQTEETQVSNPAPIERPAFSEEQRRQAAANRAGTTACCGDVERTREERRPAATTEEISLTTAETNDSSHGPAADSTRTTVAQEVSQELASRAWVDAVVPSQHQAEILLMIRSMHEAYATLEIQKIMCGDGRFLIVVRGSGDTHCLNKGASHRRSRVYFLLGPGGMQQKCHCSKIRAGQSRPCRECSSGRIAQLSPALREALFGKEAPARRQGDDVGGGAVGAARPAARMPARKRQIFQRDITGAARVIGGTARKRKRGDRADTDEPAASVHAILFERCNTEALIDLASRGPAATYRPLQQGPTLRRIIADVLGQIGGDMLTTASYEEDRMTKLGLVGRRYSGYKRESDIESFERLAGIGINPGSVGMSMFRLPSWLRDLGRSELTCSFVLDMTNAHAEILHRRHPEFQTLREYTSRREEVLASVPADRKHAKLLFISLIYDGHWASWCEKYSVDPAELPASVEAFRLEMQDVRKLDARNHPELVRQLSEEDPARSMELLQYVLNTQEERRVMDSVGAAVQRLGGTVMAFEHDGLFVHAPCAADVLLQACQSAAGYPLTVQDCARYNRDALLKQACEECGGEGWDVVDENWIDNELLAREASTANLTSHDLFASLLMTEPQVSEKVPWPLGALFKLPVLAANYLWYDATRSTWVEGGANGVARLKEYITSMLERRLQQYTLGDHLETAVIARREFGNKSFREGVESCLRSKLIVADADFHLDPVASLRYLNFKGGLAWDREAEDWVATRPEMLISRCTNWDFEECTNPAADKVEAALVLIRKSQEERGLHLPSQVPEEAVQLLDAAKQEFPELQFWFDFTQEWEGVVYELTQAARGLFGVVMAEAVYLRGSGRNGKDTVCNAFKSLGGTYVHSIACNSLCKITDADLPSPVFANCRARRIVCVREVPKDCQINQEVYKRFTDPVSEMSGRNLYEHLVHFKPQYMAFFASNGPIPIAMDNAVRDRTAIIDHVSIFKDRPSNSNDIQWKDMSALLDTYRPGFFWLLRRVYHHLLRGRSTRNVCPVPQGSLDQKALDCADAHSDEFLRLMEKLQGVKKPGQADTQLDIDAFAAKLLGLPPSEISIYMNGRGFLKTRRDRGREKNVYFYQYTFKAATGAEQLFVKINHDAGRR